jgi:hypothetical protein
MTSIKSLDHYQGGIDLRSSHGEMSFPDTNNTLALASEV